MADEKGEGMKEGFPQVLPYLKSKNAPISILNLNLTSCLLSFCRWLISNKLSCLFPCFQVNKLSAKNTNLSVFKSNSNLILDLSFLFHILKAFHQVPRLRWCIRREEGSSSVQYQSLVSKNSSLVPLLQIPPLAMNPPQVREKDGQRNWCHSQLASCCCCVLRLSLH